MNTALWIAQGIIALMMLMAGIMKVSKPQQEMAEKMAWVGRQSPQKIKFIGFSELLIALGIVLPWLTGIMPILTPIAAGALCLIMVLAITEHAKHKENKEIGFNVIMIALAAFVLWGRLGCC